MGLYVLCLMMSYVPMMRSLYTVHSSVSGISELQGEVAKTILHENKSKGQEDDN